ncbi:MAG: phospholipase D family protein, partial [Nitrospirae bacterium]|nr:phospholipase D family protein [Nitrospirota bacterium]
AVIDDNIVITGSFNWTASADKRNDENLLFINNKEAAEAYKKKFDKLWERDY